MDIKIDHRAIDGAIWTEFRRYTRVVELLRPYMVDYLALRADFAAVQTAEAEIGEALSAQLSVLMIAIPAGVDANANAQRRVGNFLGAASAFRDRSKTRLSKDFGKDSTQEAAFKAATSHWFDTSFAYRCLYQLRNFAQHHELPISFVPITADRGGDGQMTARVRLQLFPATLAASDLVNKKVRAELAALPSDPLDLSELAVGYMDALDGLMALVLGLYAPQLEEMAHYAAALYRKFEVPHDAVPVIWEGDHPSGGPGSQRRAIMMGFDEMLRAFELRERLHRERSE
ncbi:hypothetical protein BRX37_19935 [Sphingomonas sp. S-NIH.Pt3_0716]|nr:hypothetical protein BRX37_19935 [Sphingomonas sp. S-NIH.Pt3_0716]